MPSPQPTSSTPGLMMSKLQNKLFSSNSMPGKRRSTPVPLCLDAPPTRPEAENSIGRQSAQSKLADFPSRPASNPSLLSPLAFKVAFALDPKNRRSSAPPIAPPCPPSPPSICKEPAELRSPVPSPTNPPSLPARSQTLMRRSKGLLLRRFSARNEPPCPSQQTDQTDTVVSALAPSKDIPTVTHAEPPSLYTSFLDVDEDSDCLEEENSRPSLTLSDIEAALEPSPRIDSPGACTPQKQRTRPVTNARVSYSSTSTYESSRTSLFSTSVPPTPTTASTTYISHPYRRVTHTERDPCLDSSLALLAALHTLHDLRPEVAYQNQHLLTAEIEQWELRISQNKAAVRKEIEKLSSPTSPII